MSKRGREKELAQEINLRQESPCQPVTSCNRGADQRRERERVHEKQAAGTTFRRMIETLDKEIESPVKEQKEIRNPSHRASRERERQEDHLIQSPQ